MFASPPLRIAATAGPAPVYTVGSQKWNGKSPSLTLNATKKPTAIRMPVLASTSAMRVAICPMSSVPVTW